MPIIIKFKWKFHQPRAVWKASSIGLLLTDCYCLLIYFVPRLGTLLLITNSCEAICGPLTNSCYYCSVLMSFFLFVLILSQLIRKKCKNKGNKGKKHTQKTQKNKNRKQRKCAKIFPTVVVPCKILRFLECAQMYL